MQTFCCKPALVLIQALWKDVFWISCLNISLITSKFMLTFGLIIVLRRPQAGNKTTRTPFTVLTVGYSGIGVHLRRRNRLPRNSVRLLDSKLEGVFSAYHGLKFASCKRVYKYSISFYIWGHQFVSKTFQKAKFARILLLREMVN